MLKGRRTDPARSDRFGCTVDLDIKPPDTKYGCVHMKPSPPHAPARLKRMRAWLAMVAMLFGLVLVVGFGWRAWKQVQFSQRVASGEIKVESLRGWMTLAYIEQVYGVPQAELRTALGLPATGFDHRSLHDWIEVARLDPVDARQTIEKRIVEHAPPTGTVK